MSTAEFAAFDAIVFGDPGCGLPVSVLEAAEANRATWSAAIGGPIILIGTDPLTPHTEDPDLVAGKLLIGNGIDFAASGFRTGLYVSLSCYYFTAAVGTPVPLLDEIGIFTVEGQFDPEFQGVNCNAPGTIVVPTHPALAGLADEAFSLFALSPHECFTSFPDWFSVLVKETSEDRAFIIASVGVTRFSGSATGVGLSGNRAGVQIVGRFASQTAINLGAAALTITNVLDENGGEGELVRGLPLMLSPVPGSGPGLARFEARTRPNFAFFDIKDLGRGEFDFRIRLGAATIDSPALCSPARLTTAFTLDDGQAVLAARTVQPWICFGPGNKYLKTP